MTRTHIHATTLAVVFVVVSGCRHLEQNRGGGWTVVSADDMTPRQAAQRNRALAARTVMFTTLKGRLTEVVGSDGPASAISVCAKEAPQIAARVAREHGLKIGRTSFRLRNTDNAPPEWAAQLVADRRAEPTYMTCEGRLAALLPIRMLKPCVACHGPADTIPAPIKDALAEHYPDDRATGFREGDLRGWFCIEVPSVPGS